MSAYTTTPLDDPRAFLTNSFHPSIDRTEKEEKIVIFSIPGISFSSSLAVGSPLFCLRTQHPSFVGSKIEGCSVVLCGFFIFGRQEKKEEEDGGQQLRSEASDFDIIFRRDGGETEV